MNIAMILSGGVGTRFGGDIPKQYVKVGGRPIIAYGLATFLADRHIDEVIICLAPEWQSLVMVSLAKMPTDKIVRFSRPGDTRQETIYNALELMEEQGCGDDDIVIIHDAARPLVTTELIDKCLAACEGYDGVLPVLPMKDTIYQSLDGKHISCLLERNQLFAGQAPESFRFGKYLAAHKKLGRKAVALIKGSSEIAYKCGMSIRLIDGNEQNFKITTQEDLSNFENIIGHEG
jgi:2-C-methyl-D-erythritol 4-phosphate cytidylyltransferase